MKLLSKNLNETKAFAEGFLKKLKPRKKGATILALHGDLGSGKTTFAQFLAKACGIKNNLTSPTFVIEKKYQIPVSAKLPFATLIHIDSYRLKNGGELLKLDWSEISADPKNLIVIEWPELVADIIPTSAIKINFEFVDEHTRRICI